MPSPLPDHGMGAPSWTPTHQTDVLAATVHLVLPRPEGQLCFMLRHPRPVQCLPADASASTPPSAARSASQRGLARSPRVKPWPKLGCLGTLPPRAMRQLTDEPVVIVLDHVGDHNSHALCLQWQRLTDPRRPAQTLSSRFGCRPTPPPATHAHGEHAPVS